MLFTGSLSNIFQTQFSILRGRDPSAAQCGKTHLGDNCHWPIDGCGWLDDSHMASVLFEVGYEGWWCG